MWRVLEAKLEALEAKLEGLGGQVGPNVTVICVFYKELGANSGTEPGEGSGEG